MDDSSACDDIPSADSVRMLLKDLREIRQSKARGGVEHIDTTYLQMDGIGLMEINEIRPFFVKAYYEALRLKRASGISNQDDDALANDDLFNESVLTGNSVPTSRRFNDTQESRS
ncbi:DNA replication protein psf2 [Entomortierella beljakovae]|nr:DNA replication protein psf2 [Entomortierella beljakovae]